jgi:hypothetical protein
MARAVTLALLGIALLARLTVPALTEPAARALRIPSTTAVISEFDDRSSVASSGHADMSKAAIALCGTDTVVRAWHPAMIRDDALVSLLHAKLVRAEQPVRSTDPRLCICDIEIVTRPVRLTRRLVMPVAVLEYVQAVGPATSPYRTTL